jgi:hypothetical protein
MDALSSSWRLSIAAVLAMLAAGDFARAETVRAPRKSQARVKVASTTPTRAPVTAVRATGPLRRTYDVGGNGSAVPARARSAVAAPAAFQESLPMQQESLPVETMESMAPYEMEAEAPLMMGSCGEEVGCGDEVCCPTRPMGSFWYGGFEASLVQPRFDGNSGFSVMESDGATFESRSDREFDYDMNFAPRVFAGLQFADGLGFRSTWWQFDHDANSLTAQPPSNGFGEITNPPFEGVDISSNIPTDVFTAGSGLNAYTIDLEAAKDSQFSSWNLGASCGVRYANIDQTYLAELRDATSVLRGRIQFNHRVEGVGPTMAVSSSLPLTNNLDLFGRGRGSLLFGRATSNLTAGEDLDLVTPLTTTRMTARDDSLPIAEVQLGVKWSGGQRGPGGALVGWQPFAMVAMEGQFWNGVGNAVSETGDLGFFGVTSGAGVVW